MYDLPVQPGITLLLSDTMYHYSLANIHFATDVVQHQLTLLPAWLRKWYVAINMEKSEAIAFFHQLTSRCQTLSLNGSKPNRLEMYCEVLRCHSWSTPKLQSPYVQSTLASPRCQSQTIPLSLYWGPLLVGMKLSIYLLFLTNYLIKASRPNYFKLELGAVGVDTFMIMYIILNIWLAVILLTVVLILYYCLIFLLNFLILIYILTV